MANGHTIIPLTNEFLADPSVFDYLANEFVFLQPNLPHGRFPTMLELRDSINELGYELEETHDWYVTSKDDFTEIWFKGEDHTETLPNEFWFRRGGTIVLDIAQSIANRCGCVFIFNHSGEPTVLLVPDSVFSIPYQSDDQHGFAAHIIRRFPVMLERLNQAPLEEVLFILSQIRQAFRHLDERDYHESFKVIQQGITTYINLLSHEDTRIRFMAFDLLTLYHGRFYDDAGVLPLAIKNETDSHMKALKIDGLEKLIVRSDVGGEHDSPTKSLLEVLLMLVANEKEMPEVRLSATNLLARAQLGFSNAAMRAVFIDVMAQPEQYAQRQFSHFYLIEGVLKSIQNLLLSHRLEILLAALPRITVAQYAHEVLRNLLDHTFFGSIRSLSMTSLPDTYLAERPSVDETKFVDNLPRNWLYPANPTKLVPSDLLAIQRQILETVLALEVPWMVHSNLLERYGLPPTRALTGKFLAAKQ